LFKKHNANVTKDTKQQPTLVQPAHQVNLLETLQVVIKMANVILIKQTVLKEGNKLWPNHYAMHAKLAQLDNHSHKEDVKHQDHHAIVTKNTMLTLTHAEHAVLVNSHRTLSMVDKILDANHTHQAVLKEDNFNWANNNAMLAKLAQLAHNLPMVHAKHQDQDALVIKNTTLALTHVLLAQLVNSHKTPLTEDKILDAKLIPHNVLLEDNFNWPKINAMLANHAQLAQYLPMVHAKHQDQFVIATKNTTLLPTDVTLAALVKSQIT
jgi:hypothetical protein